MSAVVGLLGGSFNPPHVGHLILAQEAAWRLGLAQVCFVPSAVHPFKGDRAVLPFAHRLAMVQRAIAPFPAFSALDLEARRSGPSYTVDTIEELRQARPEARLVLLMGWDVFLEIHGWHRYHELRAKVSFAVLTRPGHETELGQVPALADPALRVFAPGSWQSLEQVPEGNSVVLLPVPGLEVSSSEIRRRLVERLPVRAYLPSAVMEYIEHHQLYGGESPGTSGDVDRQTYLD